MSCHSCHPDGHTTGRLADTSGDGSFGAPKRTLTLRGTRLTDRWAWNGQIKDLGEQVEKSLRTTLHAKNISAGQVADLTAFLHTLPPPPPLYPANENAPADFAKITRGRAIFEREACGNCHIGPLTYTSPDVYDVGFVDEKGNTKFNPPSLRGVSQGYTYFHEARVTSLETVFANYRHPHGERLPDNEISDLVRFLQSL
jgi:cytochrome c peroxidase